MQSQLALLANVPVGEIHDVKVGDATFSLLLDAVGLQSPTALPHPGSEVPIVWVLPQEAYDRFDAPGPLKGASGGDLVDGEGARHSIGKRVAHYKMLVAVPGGLGSS